MNTRGRGNVYTYDEDKFEPNRENFGVGNAGKLKILLNFPEEDINEDGKINKEDSERLSNFMLDSNYDDGKQGPGIIKEAGQRLGN